MQLTFLGTGTSAGIPLIGCTCEICHSSNTKDVRLRSSVLIQSAEQTAVIDTGPDFRAQMLQHKVEKLDAVLFTHEHRDHIAGLDDTRPYLFWTGEAMSIYCEAAVEKAIRRDFYYAFEDRPYPGSPQFLLKNIKPTIEFCVGDLQFTPLRIMHGSLPIVGFRCGNLAYITDANHIPEESWSAMEGIEILILNALRVEAHHSHFNLAQALGVVERSSAKQVYFTHISHQLGLHDAINLQLPSHVQLAYDGLTIAF